MNHCACVTSYKIYRHVCSIELFHLLARNVAVRPAAGSIPLLCLRRCFHLPGSGTHLPQRGVHSDGHHLWPRWDCGVPHRVGRDPRPALPPHVCHKRHLRSGRDYLQTRGTVPATWLINPVWFVFFLHQD